MGASRRTTTQDATETSTPTAAPEIQFGLDQNRALFDQLGTRTFPDFSTVAPFSPQTQAGLDLTTLRGLLGSPVNAAGQGAVTDIATNGIFGPGGAPTNAAAEFFLPTARGDFLDFSNNPAFLQGVEALNESVGSIFERQGRTGSGANQSSLARGAGALGAGIFNQERSNQLNAAQALGNLFQGDINNQISSATGRLNAAGLAPGSAQTDFTDLQALLGAGGAFDTQNQRLINEQINRFNFPFDNAIQAQQLLHQGAAGLGPLLGGTTTGNSTTEERTSPGLLNSILGGISAGAGLLSPFLGGGGASGAGASGSSQIFSPSTVSSVLGQINPAPSLIPSGGFNLFPSTAPPGPVSLFGGS